MAVYVDNEQICWRGKRWCHLVADTLTELHEFAARLGLRRAWFQTHASYPHYDVTSGVRTRALRNGALPADKAQIIVCCKKLKAELFGPPASRDGTIAETSQGTSHMDGIFKQPVALSLNAYAEEAVSRDRFATNPDGLRHLRFGFFGEIGGLLASQKKATRDELGPVDTQFAGEELGDALWYLVAIAHTCGVSPGQLGNSSLTDLRNTFGETAKPLSNGVTFRQIDALVRTQHSEARADLHVLLGDLAAGAGILAQDQRPQKHFREEKGLADRLGHLLALLATTAAAFGLDLENISRANLSKIKDRWPGPKLDYHPWFDQDSAYPRHERFERQMTVSFEERAGGSRPHVAQSINGVYVGDRLTDNSAQPDGYRFHDVFHLAYVAHLGWSPVIRGLLKRKRKSKPDVDENEDGARAMIIEEGIATWIFNHAKYRDYYEGVSEGRLEYGLLKQVRSMVNGYEVDKCSLWQWERAILEGFTVFRQLRDARGGQVHVDMINHTITFESLPGPA